LPVVAVAVRGGIVFADSATWTGLGDGVSWTDANNWTALPSGGSDVTFGSGTVGTIQLDGNEYANSLAFNAGFTLDSPGNTDTLTLMTGGISVGPGVTAAINSQISTPASTGINVNGSGTLIVTAANPSNAQLTVNSGTLVPSGTSWLPLEYTLNVSTSGVVVLGSGISNGVSAWNGNINQNGTMDVQGYYIDGESMSQNAGTLAITGTLSVGGGSFYDNGGVIQGTVVLGDTGGEPNLSIGPNAGNSGTFFFPGGGGNIGSGPLGPAQTIPSGVNVIFQPGSGQGNYGIPVNNAGNILAIASSNSTVDLGLPAMSNTLNNSGVLTMSAMGTPTGVADILAGSLINTGIVNITTSTDVEGSVTNSGAFNIAAGATMTVGSSGFTQSQGTLAIGGVLAMGSGTSFSDAGGVVTGTVTFASGILNSLYLESGTGNSGTYVVTGANCQILSGSSGTAVTLAAGATIIGQADISGAYITTPGNEGLNNAGLIELIGSSTEGATLSVGLGSAVLTNSGTLVTTASGSVSGVVDFISNQLVNSGTVNVQAGTQVGGIQTTGTINVAAGATLTSGGLNEVGGVLTINGSLAGSAVTLQATTDLVGTATSTAVLAATTTNTGTLTVSTTGDPSATAAVISGRLNNTTGIVNIDAGTQFKNVVTNSGTILIASGVPVGFSTSNIAQSGGLIDVAAPDLLDFSRNMLLLTGGKIVLQPGVTGAMSEMKLSQVNYQVSGHGPATTTGTIASGAVGPGQLPGFVDLAGNNVTFNVSAGTAAEQIVISAPITDGAITKSGAGAMELLGANTYTGGTTVTAGSLLIGAGGALPANGAVSVTGGKLQLAAGTGLAQMTSLAISGNGVLDIGNNRVVINYGINADPISSIAALLATGYNGGAWNGAGGIVSSAPMIVGGVSYALGYADAADPGNPAGLASGTIEIAYTLLGDADLNATVNGIDFGILAANFNKTVTSWDQGDFNYDNIVNGIDFTELAANFNRALSTGNAGVSSAHWSALEQFAAANGLLADVPEPSALAVIVLGGVGLMARRQRLLTC
jgi:autotransporter-associated beta strand protein